MLGLLTLGRKFVLVSMVLAAVFATTFFSVGAFAANVNPNATNFSINNYRTLNYTMSAPIQGEPNYTIFLPIMTWNETSRKPALIQSGYVPIMHFKKDPFADFNPDGILFPSYSFAVNISNMSQGGVNGDYNATYLYFGPNNTFGHKENITQTLALFSESTFSFFSLETNQSRSITFRFPCPFIQSDACGMPGSTLTIYTSNRSAANTGPAIWENASNIVTDQRLNITYANYIQTQATPGGGNWNLTVSLANWSSANNWTAVNLTYALIDPTVLAAMRPGSKDRPNFMTGPVTLVTQSSIGFDPDSASEPGISSVVSFVANLTNNMTNYTLNNMMVRFPVPVNVTLTFDSAIQNPYNPTQNATQFFINMTNAVNVSAACTGGTGSFNTSYVTLLNGILASNGWQVNASRASLLADTSGSFVALPVNFTYKLINFTDTGKHGKNVNNERGGFGGGKAAQMNISVMMMDTYLNLSAVGCSEDSGLSAIRSHWNYSTNISINFTATLNVPKFAEEFRNTSSNTDQAYANRTVYITSDNQAIKFSNSSLPGWGDGSNVTNSSINVTVDGVNVPPCGSTEANSTNANGGGSTCWAQTGSITIQGLSTGSHSTSVTYKTAAAVGTAAAAAGAASTTGGGGTVASTVFKITISTITSGETTTVNPGEAAGFTGIDILTSETLNNVKLDTGKTSAAPSGTPSLEGKVNTYIQVNTSGMSDSQISSIKLRFKVTKQWLTDNGVDANDVVLWRHNSAKWSELSTIKTGEDDTKVSYEATSPGLSTFAIATKSSGATPTAPTEPTVPTGEEKKEEVPVTQNITVLAIIVILLVIGAIWYTQKKK